MKSLYYGFLAVGIYDSYVHVTYNGNMGNSIEDVRKNFNKLFRGDYFDAVMNKAFEVDGSPDYAWWAKVNIDDFNNIVGSMK